MKPTSCFPAPHFPALQCARTVALRVGGTACLLILCGALATPLAAQRHTAQQTQAPEQSTGQQATQQQAGQQATRQQAGHLSRVQAHPGAVQSWQGNWQKDGLSLPFELFVAPQTSWGQPEASGRPLAVYLANLPMPRIGKATDEQILNDLLAQGIAVLKLDASTLPDQSPELENTFGIFYSQLQQTLDSLRAAQPGVPAFAVADKHARTSSSEVFVVPAGYTVSRTVPFWNIETHGSEGSMQRIVDVYNDKIVPKFKRPPASDAHEIRNRKGEPLDFNLYLDIVHPAGVQPGAEVPAILNFGTHSMRQRTSRPGAGTDRMKYALGFAADGYAWVSVDHPYIPLARHQHFDYFEPYTLENQNALAVATAAVRYLNAHKDAYGLNGRFGAMGHSKASYSVTRLLDPAHPQGAEHSTFKGFQDSPPRPQPWPGEPSQIEVGFTSMGLGVMRTQYLTPQSKSLMTAVGRGDQYGQWKHFPAMVDAARKNNLNYVDLWMEDKGHDYPGGLDKERGIDRYVLVRSFFDQILQPRGEVALEVLYTYPRDGAEGVAADGTSRTLPADDLLPQGMRNIPRSEPITVRFARPLDETTIDGNVILTLEEQSNAIPGQWQTAFQETALQFTPQQPLAPASRYTLRVLPGLRDKAGNTLKSPHTTRFTTAP